MIERVAESLWQADSLRAMSRERNISWCEVSPKEKSKWVDFATVAIREMREPSDQMKGSILEGYYKSEWGGINDCISFGEYLNSVNSAENAHHMEAEGLHVYQAMIDGELELVNSCLSDGGSDG